MNYIDAKIITRLLHIFKRFIRFIKNIPKNIIYTLFFKAKNIFIVKNI
jgi:hypothetical protein